MCPLFKKNLPPQTTAIWLLPPHVTAVPKQSVTHTVPSSKTFLCPFIASQCTTDQFRLELFFSPDFGYGILLPYFSDRSFSVSLARYFSLLAPCSIDFPLFTLSSIPRQFYPLLWFQLLSVNWRFLIFISISGFSGDFQKHIISLSNCLWYFSIWMSKGTSNSTYQENRMYLSPPITGCFSWNPYLGSVLLSITVSRHLGIILSFLITNQSPINSSS